MLRRRRRIRCSRPPSAQRISLVGSVAFLVRRMRSAIFAPVVRVLLSPSGLRPELVVAILTVGAQPVFLPVAAASALTRGRRAISLMGNIWHRHECNAACETKARRFHGCPPRRDESGERGCRSPAATSLLRGGHGSGKLGNGLANCKLCVFVDAAVHLLNFVFSAMCALQTRNDGRG